MSNEARNKYYREYRKKNPEKIRAINKRYWEKKEKNEKEVETDD